MPLTAGFVADPNTFINGRSVVVVEDTTQAWRDGQTLGANNVIAPLVSNFNFEVFGNAVTTVICHIRAAGAPATAQPCYFLPYCPDAATTMTIAGPPNYFITSALSGCTVQVVGPANAPTITHGNAGNTFANHGAGMAQTTINGMLPPAGGAANATWTRADYHNKINAVNLQNAKQAFPWPEGYRFKQLDMKTTTAGGFEVGSFFFGVRNGAGNWTFWAQTTVGVTGRLRTGYLCFGVDRSINEEVVMGLPEQVFP